MSATATQSEIRLARLLDEQMMNQQLHENLVAAIEASDGKTPTESQAEQVKMYREKAIALSEEITQLADTVEEARRAEEASRQIRRALAAGADGVDVDGDGIVYRDFYTFARDVVITRESTECGKIAQRVGQDEVLAARERLQLVKRTPANTLSSNVAGLTPDQHIAQIFQVIDRSRPLVTSANRSTLERGQLTYPKIVTRPVVAVQNTEKTEAGNQGMVVNMMTATASTYLGGGDLSWQAINWSTPDALRLWFDLAAADYALKTEQDAGEIVQTAGFSYNVSTPLGATPTYDEYIEAIADGASEVYGASGRMPDTLYFAPDEFFKFAALVPATTGAAFLSGGVSLTGANGSFAGLRIVVSRGLDAGVSIVGDSQALLVAETPGAPIELRVVEPAIGGVEVGLIGAFEAVVVDDGAFSLLTTAS